MKLIPNALGLASAIMLGVLDILCSIMAVLLPVLYAKIFGLFFHAVAIDPTKQITFGSFINGFILLIILAYISGWFFAWLYNRFVG